MISRHWKGIARPDQADAYVRHLETDTFPQLAAIPGFVRASILRRTVPEGIEFQIVTVWKTLDSIHGFAGERAEVAVVPPVAQAMMVSYDSTVTHYEVVDSFEGR